VKFVNRLFHACSAATAKLESEQLVVWCLKFRDVLNVKVHYLSKSSSYCPVPNRSWILGQTVHYKLSSAHLTFFLGLARSQDLASMLVPITKIESCLSNICQYAQKNHKNEGFSKMITLMSIKYAVIAASSYGDELLAILKF
jgi:hypothetical protein